MSNWTPRLDPGDAPLYVAIANQIAAAIEDGALAGGARLPTHRDLARRLGISIHTVSQAYAEAERRDLVIGETGRGTFVRARLGEREASFIMDRRRDDVIDLSTNRPVYEELHADRVRATLGEIAQARDVSPMLVCRPIAGMDRHRAAGAAWLRRRRIEVGPERVLITNGAMHGLQVALSTLTRPGDLVLTEALTDHGTIGLTQMLHFRLQGLALDAEGILPDAFATACASGEAKVLCTTPCLANPTVALMSAARRREIAAIARRYEVAVVENDVYGMLPADGPPPLWTFLPEQTYYVTSLTKCLVSGLRTGYLVAPARATPTLVRRIRVSSWMATPLVAEIASRWIAEGIADELVGWQRSELALRHRIADRLLAGLDYHHHPHSLHLWLTLPARWRGEAFVSEARLRDNVAITPAEPFVVGGDGAPHSVRLSLSAAATRSQMERGLRTLADILHLEAEPFYMPT